MRSKGLTVAETLGCVTCTKASWFFINFIFFFSSINITTNRFHCLIAC